jgi:SAM-dependent methyltransferase
LAALDPVQAGQAVYTPWTLWAYDAFVLGFSNRFLWRCPTPRLLELYRRNVGAQHLDIGVGTGYFLDKTAWPVAQPEITLMDLNPHSLEAAARRIARYRPRAIIGNALQPLTVKGPFSSVGLNYLLHCLPGTLREKSVVFDHLRPALAPGARVMDFYNRKSIFANASDSFASLERELRARFADVQLTRHGAVALFEARAA